MTSLKEDLKRLYVESNVVGKYVLLMIVFFLLIRLLAFTGLQVTDWFALPQQPMTLLTRPWTLVTYMFTHIETRHVFWNLILLWSAGRIHTDILGSKRFVKNYWLGGFAGAIVFLLAYNLDPKQAIYTYTLVGASAAVLSVLVSATVYRPEYEVQLMLLGRVKLLYITLILLVLTLPLSRANMGGDMAHLGGILWGLYYGWRARKGSEPAVWFDRLADQVTAYVRGTLDQNQRPKRKAKMKAYTQAQRETVPRNDQEYNAMRKAKQDRIDQILEKISKRGYESLTAEEKAILFKASNKDGNG